MTIIRDIRVRQVKCGVKMAHELTKSQRSVAHKSTIKDVETVLILGYVDVF